MQERIDHNRTSKRRLEWNEQVMADAKPSSHLDLLSMKALHCPSRTVFRECLRNNQIDCFVEQIAALPDHLRGFLTLYSPQDYREMGAKLYLADNAQGGYGLVDDELISVFSLPGAHLGASIIADALGRGAMRVDVLDAHKGGAPSDPNNPGKLVRLYSAFGFHEVKRNSWNMEYAPICWDYALWGCPDQVIMERNG